jgi:DNA-binding transcriptional LysR family regulator
MSVSMQLSDRIGRRMKLQDLRVFMTVMQLGSMGKAAQSLNVTQPAVSKAIADLEHALGVRLFDRHRQGIEATEYSRALLDCGMTIFDELRQGVKNIEFLADPTTGEVRIGNTLIGTVAGFVAGIIDRLSRRYPRMVFHVAPGGQDTLRRELNERRVDLVITRGGNFKDEKFSFETLYDDPFVVVAGVQNPLARRRRIELAELVNEPWALVTPETRLGGAVMEAFRASGLDCPRATLVGDYAEVRLSLVAAGRFLTIAPSSMLRFPTKRPELKVLPVELPLAIGPVGIVTLKNRTLNPVAKLFIQQAHEAAKPLARQK